MLQEADGVSSSVEDVTGVKDDARDSGMMTEEVAVVFSDHSEDQGSEIGNVPTGTSSRSGGGGGGGDYSESSSSGSSIMTGVSAGSVDNSSSSESAAVTGGLSEETIGSNQLQTTADDDISSMISIEKPIGVGGGSSVHESLDDEADLSLEEMALSMV